MMSRRRRPRREPLAAREHPGELLAFVRGSAVIHRGPHAFISNERGAPVRSESPCQTPDPGIDDDPAQMPRAQPRMPTFDFSFPIPRGLPTQTPADGATAP